MARPLTRDQQLQNRAFLAALRETGNIRLAARRVGRAVSTMHTRRGAHPAFAQGWAAAVAYADARFNASGGLRRPAGEAATTPRDAATPGTRAAAHRTAGGEAVVVRRRDGKLQQRLAQPGKLTRACEQAFLAALSATCNVALSAKAAGASQAAFYRRRRQRPGFAREWGLALAEGYAALELALLEAARVEGHADDAWRHNDPPAMPPMTPEAALQLMYLHQKEARLGGTPALLRRRPGESVEALRMRLTLMHEHRMRQERDKHAVAEAARRERGLPGLRDEAPVLPDLAQVTGWSKAGGRTPWRAGVALFGGWRMEELRKKERAEEE